MTEIYPQFKDNCATLAFSSNDYFLPYLTTTLHSLVDHINPEHNYDIIIFSKDASEENQEHIIHFISRANVSVRFVDVSADFGELKLYTAAHMTIETYFRLLIPRYLKHFDRVLYLDADIIIMDDIYKLYAMDMQGYPLAATEECLFSASLGINGEPLLQYVRDELKLSDPESYLQAGVLLFDVQQFNHNNYCEKLLEMACNYNYKQLDQDVLNKFFNANYCRFDNEWNWPPMQKHMKELRFIEMMSPVIRAKYLAVKHPKIIHYADKNKPWFDSSEDKAVIWWHYARGTPFYELALQRMSQKDVSTLTLALSNHQKYTQEYAKYKRLAFFSWGKRSLRHQTKRDYALEQLRQINQTLEKYGVSSVIKAK